MQGVREAVVAAMLVGTVTVAAAQQRSPQPASAQNPAIPPTTPGPAGATTANAGPGAVRVFSAPVGLIFATVRPERVADFEKAMAYVQAALEKSTDPQVQAQARGWRLFKATEPGPNSTVLYVFGFNPTVPGADYGLGRILADAYPDSAQLQEIWRLYTASVTSGGSLLNLTPLTLPPPEPLRPTSASPTARPDTRTPPVDANPNVPGR